MKLLDHQRLRDWSGLRPWRSLASLLLDFVCVLLVAGGAVWFHRFRSEHALHWAWEVPVLALVVFHIGILQHRIGLMGHEASHYLLLPHRVWNDWLANLLIFYPLFSTISLYRKRHLGHHLHPNDPMHDPNLFGGKMERIWARFPMSKKQFMLRYYVMFLWPPFVLRNLLDLFLVLTVDKHKDAAQPQTKTLKAGLLGQVCFIAMSTVVVACAWHDVPSWPMLLGLYAVALLVWAWLPAGRFTGGGGMAGDLKWAALLRLSFHTLSLLVLGWLSTWLGGLAIAGFVILWIFPLVYVFPYLMLLREIYQHANAGTGDLNNTRVIHAGPFTRWALLGYGNDCHLIHHLYPNIPHDRLHEVHAVLLRESEEYAAAVKETFGIYSSHGNQRSLLDTLAR